MTPVWVILVGFLDSFSFRKTILTGLRHGTFMKNVWNGFSKALELVLRQTLFFYLRGLNMKKTWWQKEKVRHNKTRTTVRSTVVRNAGCARSRNTWKLTPIFQWINQSNVPKTAHPPLKNLGWEKYNNFQSY